MEATRSVGVDAIGYDIGHGKSIYVDLWAMPGEFDAQLKWPAKAKFTIELVNPRGVHNASCSRQVDWNKPSCLNHIDSINRLGTYTAGK